MKKNLKKLFLLFVFVVPFLSKGQNFTPLDTLGDSRKKQQLIEQYQKRTDAYENSLKQIKDKKLRKKLIENYKAFAEYFIEEEIEAGRFVFDQRFVDYANRILKELLKANPQVQEQFQVLISRVPSLNAYCTTDGLIVLNMGMFYYLENDAQVAGVMAHELSHKLLEHSLNYQKENLQESLSKSSKENLKKLKKQKYNQKKEAFELFKQKVYASGEKRRQYEFEADSLGYVLLKKSSFEGHDYIKALQLYALYDTVKPKGLEFETYKQLFDLPGQAFNETWLKGEDYSQYNYELYQEKLDEDSLSSHPEDEERVKRLKLLFPELKEERAATKSSKELKALEKTAKWEVVPNLYRMEQYGVSLYNCMLMIQRGEDPTYYKKCLGRNFQKIYEARKEYKLNKHLAQIVPNEQSESYRAFLSFMWNLSLKELKHIADHYAVNEEKEF